MVTVKAPSCDTPDESISYLNSSAALVAVTVASVVSLISTTV